MNLDSWTPRDVARRVGTLAGLTTSSFLAAYLGFELNWSVFLILPIYLAVTVLVAGTVYLGMRLRYGADFYGPRDASPFKNVLEPSQSGVNRDGSRGKLG